MIQLFIHITAMNGVLTHRNVIRTSAVAIVLRPHIIFALFGGYLMDYIEKFEPKHVLEHFKNICDIPHISNHEQALCKYIKDFAQKNGHEYYEDEAGNLIVYVNATQGYETVPPFLMQAHMDMVAAKEAASNHNFLTDSIKTHLVDGHYLYADGTTLGADNAVGMMNMLALMEDKSVVHPPLEMLFTVCEEAGMVGIRKVDYSRIKSRRMINMDCGDPDVMCVSTAGAANCLLRLPLKKKAISGVIFEISIDGLLGGHAGLMIDSGRISAVTVMGRILCQMSKCIPLNIVYTSCDRVCGIVPAMKALITIDEKNIFAAEKAFEKIAETICREYADPEEGLHITLKKSDEKVYSEMLDEETTENLQRMLYMMPFGVTKRDWREKETILCSNNTMEVAFKENSIEMETMLRAPEDTVKEELFTRIGIIADWCGAEIILLDSFSGWPYRRDSQLQKLCCEVFAELTGEQLKMEKHNSCAETGIVAGAIPDMDIVAIAPLGRGAHTPTEYLDLDTVKPFWDFLCLLLKKMCTEVNN